MTLSESSPEQLDYRLVAFFNHHDPAKVPAKLSWHGLRPRAADGMIRTFCGLTPHTPGVTIGQRDRMPPVKRCRICSAAEAKLLR